jgi:hypothetical protein
MQAFVQGWGALRESATAPFASWVLSLARTLR